MLMIVRLFPRTDLSRVWNYVEQEIKDNPSLPYTPLYATQSEGMMNVGVIVDVNHTDDISDFLVKDIIKCDEIHHTKTISLMNPVFFPIPKKKPEEIHRYLIRIYTHPKDYKRVYEYLSSYNYPFNLFPIYISFSLGDEDIIMTVGADSEATVKKFLREHIRSIDGVEQASCYHVLRAKRFAPLAKLIEEQKEYLAKGKKASDIDTDFDWIEDINEHAMLTGAFQRDL